MPLGPTPSQPHRMLSNAGVQPSHLLRLQYQRQHPVEIQAPGGQSHMCFQGRYTGFRRSESHVNPHRTLEISFSEEHTCQEGLFFESRGVAPVNIMH